ncbi:hypothetical protein ig2599ANME_2362 [groundwater metagenome]
MKHRPKDLNYRVDIFNVKMRAMIKQTIANAGKQNPEFLEYVNEYAVKIVR